MNVATTTSRTCFSIRSRSRFAVRCGQLRPLVVSRILRTFPQRPIASRHGEGYRLAHYEKHKVAAGMQCLPDSLVGTEYYVPTGEGREGWLAERLADVKRWREGRPDDSREPDQADQ